MRELTDLPPSMQANIRGIACHILAPIKDSAEPEEYEISLERLTDMLNITSKALAGCAQTIRYPAKEPAHPEDFCDRCGLPNVTWFAPSELWNKVIRQPNDGADEMLCPTCFIRAAELAGINPTAWRIDRETFSDFMQSVSARRDNHTICWHCLTVLVDAPKPRCEQCPDECDEQNCPAPGCEAQ